MTTQIHRDCTEDILYLLPTSLSDDVQDVAAHAIETYGFLIPRNTKVSWLSFANAIASYSSNDRTQHISQVISIHLSHY
jgi:hypothetical protein